MTIRSNGFQKVDHQLLVAIDQNGNNAILNIVLVVEMIGHGCSAEVSELRIGITVFVDSMDERTFWKFANDIETILNIVHGPISHFEIEALDLGLEVSVLKVVKI